MKKSPRIPVVFWRIIKLLNQVMLAHYGPRSKAASRVLVLTTIGRNSGQLRSTPLQFEEVEEIYYVVSARGIQSDWYRNLVACPKVDVKVGDKCFSTSVELMTDPIQIADFLEVRLKRHPHFMGFMLRLEGLQSKFTRTDLERFAERLAIVALHQENQ
jgi:deazaflavin-dependent oxidoreductase (nitroreductase family)